MGCWGGYANQPKELAVDFKVWKVELEKQIACMESGSRSPPAEPVGPYPSVNRGTSGCDYIGKTGKNGGGTGDYLHVRSNHFVASGGHDGHR